MGFRRIVLRLARLTFACWLVSGAFSIPVQALGFAAPVLQPSAGSAACRVATIEGEAAAGHAFERPIGNGLKILLEPIASGWIVRVLPMRGPRGKHDYAELANPPYRSVSPLLIGTDFSFRAQDALAWNPRHFRFAPDKASFARLTAAFDDIERLDGPAGQTAAPANLPALRLAESRLATLVGRTPEAELTFLDARLVQGGADKAQTAAMVASHLNRSAHEIEQTGDSRPTPLGRLIWVRFRIRLDLPTTFQADKTLEIDRRGCL